MQADRENKHTALAEKYASSDLKRQNMRQLENLMNAKTAYITAPEAAKEQLSNSETSNSWWWITYVLLQVAYLNVLHHKAPCEYGSALLSPLNVVHPLTSYAYMGS